jgi:sugar lactone lactonase YvrE
MNIADGTIERYRFKTQKQRTWARGLTMPNGLAFLPNGDALTSRDLGSGTGITRVPAKDRAHPQVNWASIDDTNGLAVDPTGKWLYVNRTFTPDAEVDRVRIADPSQVEPVASLGAAKGPDDLTVDRKGRLLVATFLGGEIVRVNPATGVTCVIASGLGEPTSVRFGAGGDWPRRNLYVTTADGFLRELTPPPH